MGRADFLKLGDFNSICDRCGFKFKASQLREEWQGLRVCKSCYEPRHEQDFLKGHPDNPQVPWTRPDNDNPTDVIVVGGERLNPLRCDNPNSIPGQMVPGCSVPGWSKGYTNPL